MPPAIKNRGIHQTIRGNGERIWQIARLVGVVSCTETETHSRQPSMLQHIGAPHVDAVLGNILRGRSSRNYIVLYDVCVSEGVG